MAKKIIIISLVLLTINLSVPVSASLTEDVQSDFLFIFFVNYWIKPRADNQADREQVNADFLARLIEKEEHFENLPEYWELRAFFDLRLEDRARVRSSLLDDIDFVIHYERDIPLNPLMLEKALSIDPNRAAVKRYLGCIKVADTLPEEWPADFDEIEGSVQSEAYYNLLADAFSEAGVLDPDNGYYPFFEAKNRIYAGDYEKAFELFERAGGCEAFSYPKLFPLSYAIENIDYLREDVFTTMDLSPDELLELYVTFWFYPTLPSNIRIKFAYEAAIVYALQSGDWRGKFTTLQKAACRFGKSEYADGIQALVAKTLIMCCLKEAVLYARYHGDSYLEMALIKIWHECFSIREITGLLRNELDQQRGERNLFQKLLEALPLDVNSSDPIVKIIKAWRDAPKPEDKWIEMLSMLAPNPVLEMLIGNPTIKQEHEFNVEYIWPIFDRIWDFDYSDPQSWYESWYAQAFLVEGK